MVHKSQFAHGRPPLSTGIDPDDVEELPDAELDGPLARRVQAMIAEADREVDDLRVAIRWHHAQMLVIRRAARQMGMPYQTYIKQAALRQAFTDLKDAAAVGLGSPKSAAAADTQIPSGRRGQAARKINIRVNIDDESPDAPDQTARPFDLPLMYVVRHVKAVRGTTGGRN